mmetsp:Transcript_23585/g.65623  ORF Transcript_23585/g.65623 Transcript_23585/m.65623 type:complete len:465 (+) Transcript_23585:111-1505(+)
MSRPRLLELALILSLVTVLSFYTIIAFRQVGDSAPKKLQQASFLPGSLKEGHRETHRRHEGSVYYVTTDASGFNNQRQSAMMAWVLAYLTGHTLLWKDYHPAYTGVASDSNQYDHGAFWDLIMLQKHVQVCNVSHKHHFDDNDNDGYRMNLGTKFDSTLQVQQLGRAYKNISYGAGWSYMSLAFPWLRPLFDSLSANEVERKSTRLPHEQEGSDIFLQLMESFTFTQHIQHLAQQVIQQLAGNNERGKLEAGGPLFIGMHQRQHRQPAVNCRQLNTSYLAIGPKVGHPIRTYSKGACQGVDWSNVVAKLFSNNDDKTASLPIYVAHDSSFPMNRDDFRNDYRRQIRYYKLKYGPKSPQYMSALKQGSNRTQTNPSSPYPPGTKDASDFQDTLFKGVPPAVVAAVEQEILIRSTYFISSLHSSYSEFVIFKRAVQTPPPRDAQQNYDIWMEKLLLFDEVPKELLP